jgi:hypothetical protein
MVSFGRVALTAYLRAMQGSALAIGARKWPLSGWWFSDSGPNGHCYGPSWSSRTWLTECPSRRPHVCWGRKGKQNQRLGL